MSDDAVRALGGILEKYAYMISEKACELTKHAKRKTVTEEDINLAYKLTKH